MKRIDSVALSVISELFVNLSAGWFLAAFVVPNSSEKLSLAARLGLLTVDLILGIVCLVIALRLRRLEKDYDKYSRS